MEWLYWAIFSTSHDSEEAQTYADEIEEYLKFKEEIDGRPLQPGHEKDVRPVKVTLDPVVTTHRPLLWYFVNTPELVSGSFLTILADRVLHRYRDLARALLHGVPALCPA